MSILDTFSLSGQRVLVTGGNQGLGRAFALALAEAGATVAISGRNHARNLEVAKVATSNGLTIEPIDADVTNDSDVTRMTDRAVQVLGGIDTLVNNAGVCYHAPALAVTDAEWSEVFDLNVRALWKCSLAACTHMKNSGGGSIINIGSISALIVNRPQMQPAYNASKAAVHQLTKSLAAEWAPLGIRVNAFAPGYVKTDMAPVDRPEFQRYWIDDTPMKRYATPNEVAACVVFLASKAASFMTGSVLVADGGYTLW